jgi:hypothetical protein
MLRQTDLLARDKIEIPWFVEFQQKYAAEGLTSIGVAMDEEGWRLVRPSPPLTVSRVAPVACCCTSRQ